MIKVTLVKSASNETKTVKATVEALGKEGLCGGGISAPF